MGHSTLVLVPCSCFGFRPSPVPKKREQQPPTFRPMSVVAKRSPISATAEVLYKRSPKNQFGGRKVVGQAAVVRRAMGQET